MSKTVVGLFSAMEQANQVKQELINQGFESQNIKVVANEENTTSTSYNTTANDSGYTDIGSGGGTGIGEKISNFFRSLSGGDHDVHDHYATGINNGGALLAVTVADGEADEVAEMLKDMGAREIEGNRQKTTGAPYSDQTSATGVGGTTIPVIEEELQVGKREVNRGGVRIYSHVVERPVEADVNLREERINVERRPVNRTATAADFAAGEGSVVEMNATGEEAVIGKTSRVVEEVVVGKETTQRNEAIKDSVRKTEVEVEEIPGETLTGRNANKDRY